MLTTISVNIRFILYESYTLADHTGLHDENYEIMTV